MCSLKRSKETKYFNGKFYKDSLPVTFFNLYKIWATLAIFNSQDIFTLADFDSDLNNLSFFR